MRGDGAYLIDSSGKRYLDFSSQLVCVNLGYGNKRVLEAIKEQMDRLQYLGPNYAIDVRAEAAEALASILPENLRKFVFSSSGSEANEDALKIVRSYKFPSYKIIARYMSYHGNTSGTLSITGDPRRNSVELHSNVRGTVFVPDPYCFRCPFSVDECEECEKFVVKCIEYVLRNEGHVAAIFFETITGTNGVVVPSREFYRMVRELCDKYNVLLVLDEVMSGWGRTGRWFAFEHFDIEPDIMTTAKGATSSYIPIGITAVNDDIAEYFNNNFFPIGHTFAYHPLAMAAMKAVIEEMRRRRLVKNAERVGRYLGNRLIELMDSHPSIGDVRGIGLFWAVELVKSRVDKKPFNTREDKLLGKPLMVDKVANKMMDHGVLLTLRWLSHLVIAPPLIVTEEDIDLGIEALDDALKIADKEVY